jgi:hypothetical protein
LYNIPPQEGKADNWPLKASTTRNRLVLLYNLLYDTMICLGEQNDFVKKGPLPENEHELNSSWSPTIEKTSQPTMLVVRTESTGEKLLSELFEVMKDAVKKIRILVLSGYLFKYYHGRTCSNNPRDFDSAAVSCIVAFGRLLCYKKFIKAIPLSPEPRINLAKQGLDKIEFAFNAEGFNPASENVGAALRREDWQLGTIRGGGMQLLETEQRQAALFFTAHGEPLGKDEANNKVKTLWELPTGTGETWFENIRRALKTIWNDATQYTLDHPVQGIMPLRKSPLRNRLVYLYNVIIELLQDLYRESPGMIDDVFLQALPQTEMGFLSESIWSPQIEEPTTEEWASAKLRRITSSQALQQSPSGIIEPSIALNAQPSRMCSAPPNMTSPEPRPPSSA